jgi:hypothetical protein
MESTKEGYEHKMEAQLAQWGARIDALESRASKGDAATKSTLNRQASALAKLQDVATEHYDELKSVPAETWLEVRNRVEVKWSQLSIAMESFWSKVS